MLRRLERFEEASAAYRTAIKLLEQGDPNAWFLYYARGITFERRDLWPQAEADFRKALALNPDQPNVLNYLGYSLVEKKIKLDEALEMIEKAAAARPDSGFHP
jgi:Flp pilus assembly protein TadD